MAEVINFNKKRKTKIRLAKEQKASENRITFGRTKKEKQIEKQVNERNERHLDGHKLEKKESMTSIDSIIGDYNAFFSDVLYRMKKAGISISGMPMSHLLYRTTTITEYEQMRDELKIHCSEFVETQFNDRAVSILILKNPLLMEDGFTVSMIELPAPRLAHMYPSGLESIGIIVGKKLPEFIKQHEDVLTGVKEHGQYCQPAFITFNNDKSAKFYDISLREIILLQGWQMELLEIDSITGIRGQ